MGRFDALTHLEDTKEQHSPSPVVPSPIEKAPSTPPPNTFTNVPKKPEIMISRNHERISHTNTLKEKPIKYSTLLDAALIKKIRLAAAENDIKDYEVIEQALTKYFTKNK